jgi:hypothetical protein
MRITPSGGGTRIDLDGDEARLIGAVLDDLTVLFDSEAAGTLGDGLPPGAASEVVARLFPDGYRDDPQAAAAFAEMTAASLLAERSGRLEQCRADLAGAGTRGRRLRMELDADAVERWLRVLNDARLALGTLLHVSEDDAWDLGSADLSDPLEQQRARYVWLSAVQDALVQAVMGD